MIEDIKFEDGEFDRRTVAVVERYHNIASVNMPDALLDLTAHCRVMGIFIGILSDSPEELAEAIQEFSRLVTNEAAKSYAVKVLTKKEKK